MNILDEIIENKKVELNNRKSNKEIFKSIFNNKKANIIWEIKLASPKFNLTSKVDLDELFNFYWTNDKIKAVSNLIDEKYFSWDINRWKLFKKKYNKPIFFKEFVIDINQIDWASYYWYDAILLLERVLSENQLLKFIDYSNSKNIFPIIEVDNENWLKKILKFWNELDFWIAINCRNLWNMEIDRNRHFTIYKNFKDELKNKLVFAFSWIDNLKQVDEYVWKYNGILIGTYFINQIKK